LRKRNDPFIKQGEQEFDTLRLAKEIAEETDFGKYVIITLNERFGRKKA